MRGNKVESNARILDLGCGNKKRAGAIGLDINPRSMADVVHDLNKLPYPFEDSGFDEIYLDNVLEHLENVVATVEELPSASVAPHSAAMATAASESTSTTGAASG